MKKFTFRLQVVLDMRERELEERQMELSKIMVALNSQQAKLQSIIVAQNNNTQQLENLYQQGDLDITQIDGHRGFGNKLIVDEQNQGRVIANTEAILKVKQQEVVIAHQKVEALRKLKEKQEKEYYQKFLQAESKELDDITTSRYKVGHNDTSIDK